MSESISQKSRRYRLTLAALLCAGAMVPAQAQNYPSRPVRMLAAEAGGGADLIARMMAQGMSATLGQQVLIENRGGSAAIAAQVVAKAAPDGYTLLFYGTNVWLLPFLQDDLPYDPVRDLAPITMVAVSPNVLVVHPSVPVNSVKELIDLARARPGFLNYASGGNGSSSQLAAELFKSMAATDLVRVSYKGSGPALNDVVAGRVQVMFPNAASVTQHIRSGKLKGLAVASSRPSALAPGLPTVAATGLPGYEYAASYGMFSAGGTPAAIINQLNQHVVQVLARDEVKQKLASSGAEPVGNTPAEFGATVKSDMARLGKVIRDAGIRAE